MEYCGIIITGTSGSGKTTIAEKLCITHDQFKIIKAVTTRAPRQGIDEPNYRFIDKEKFKEYKKQDVLITSTDYRKDNYGVLLADYNAVIMEKKIPILIISPESSKVSIKINGQIQNFLSFFIDADDSELTNRLSDRDGAGVQKEIENRNFDREFKSFSLFNLLNKNKSIEEIINLIVRLWDLRVTGGIIPYQILSPLIEYAGLIEPFLSENISAASYDLTLGEEYFQNGEIRVLTDRNPVIKMNPGDFIIAESKEIVNLPSSFAARFDLTVSMFCQGLILSNGPQVDPGFQGRLFCLLFNTSNRMIELKKDLHYATIEFIKLIEPTSKPYQGKYQKHEKIMHYLPIHSNYSIISELITQVKELNKKEPFYLKYLPLLISSLAIVVAVLVAFLKLSSSSK